MVIPKASVGVLIKANASICIISCGQSIQEQICQDRKRCDAETWLGLPWPRVNMVLLVLPTILNQVGSCKPSLLPTPFGARFLQGNQLTTPPSGEFVRPAHGPPYTVSGMLHRFDSPVLGKVVFFNLPDLEYITSSIDDA